MTASLCVAATAPAPPPNRLIHEKSPYLRQHADNPVDWYPWGPAAFEKARRENKLIFLSVGYSTCHWCHVMERESFANPDVAAVLNANFVPILVDREERPDVDRVYLTFVQATTGAGGWPTTVWLTPDLKPILGGTYFPPESSPGQPGLKAVSTRLAALWAAQPGKIAAQAEQMLQALAADTKAATPAGTLDLAALRARGFAEARTAFDAEHGGFDRAPKFPNAPMLEFLFDLHATSRDAAQREQALGPAVKTLRAMAAGGIHDQLGGGFYRYSADERWRVPHFEKMLADQAQLANSYLTAWQLTAEPEFKQTAQDTLGYVRRQLTDPAGGFYSAEDADSALPAGPESGPPASGGPAKAAASGEGAFYVWTAEEIEAALGAKDAPLFGYAFGVEPNGNTGTDAEGTLAGKSVLYRAHTAAECAAKFGLSEATVRATLAAAVERLRLAREKRPHPFRDDKIVTAWNGLMISAFARAAQIFSGLAIAATSGSSRERQRGDDLATAERAAAFLRAELYDPATGRLARSYRAGRRDEHGFAEDYAFLVQGLLDLYEADFDVRWLEWAMQLQEKQNELFWDEKAGGYFANAAGDASVLLRLKEANDGAEPSPNSVAVRNLARLAALLHRDDWREMAARTVRAFAPVLDRTPLALPQLLASAGWLEGAPQQIIIVGEPASPDTARLVGEVWPRFLPRHVAMRIDAHSRPFWERHVELIRALPVNDARPATAYVCENFACQLPTSDPAVLAKQLRPGPNADSAKAP